MSVNTESLSGALIHGDYVAETSIYSCVHTCFKNFHDFQKDFSQPTIFVKYCH